MGERITVSFQDEVYAKIEEDRGRTPFSTYINDEFRKKFNIKKIDKRQRKKKNERRPK